MGKRRESFEAVQKSVARVKGTNGQTWGTGFFISREGHLLTCAHVVQDAGGWKNVRILDQPVNCLYEGDPERDDFCLLQVEDIQVTPVELGKDFDPADEFLSFGFSNNDFYGAPIRGEITAFVRCGKLGDQKLIRLETFSDAQRIEGGQSGAPVLVFQKGKYRVVGIIVASEDLNGGLAIPSSVISKRISKLMELDTYKKISSYLVVSSIATIALFLAFFMGQSYFSSSKTCSSDAVSKYRGSIKEAISGERYGVALNISEDLISKCEDESEAYIYKGAALMHLNRFEDAILAFKESLEKKPSLKASFNLGVAYSRAGNPEKAITTLEPLLQDPGLTNSSLISKNDIYYNLGLNNQKAARQEFRKSNKLWNLSKMVHHLEKAEEMYAIVIRETKTTCQLDDSGNCYSKQRRQTADNLTAIYAVLYSLSKNETYLDKAISSM
jgi:tetratricopeptide (TPR) repeat protein